VIVMPRFIKDDPDELLSYLAGIGRGLVAFDGRSGAGKTPLAREMARRIGGAAVDVDAYLPKATDTDLTRGLDFADMLHIEDLRRAIEAGGPLVLMSGVCARPVLERLQLPAAAIVWVQWAPLLRLDQICRDFLDYDEDAIAPGGRKRSIHAEVQTYVDAYDARRRADVVFINAYADRHA
jgi:hypothetical protein